jgi:putative flippase GtrA
MPPPQPTPIRRSIAPQFLRYSGAGVVGTALQYAVLILLVEFVGLGAVAASNVGAILGAVVNYRLNHRYTFASQKAHGHALPRFALISAAGLVLNTIALSGLLAFVGPHYLVAQVAVTAVVLVAGFLANRVWTF